VQSRDQNVGEVFGFEETSSVQIAVISSSVNRSSLESASSLLLSGNNRRQSNPRRLPPINLCKSQSRRAVPICESFYLSFFRRDLLRFALLCFG
jgi:hypothetical protein